MASLINASFWNSEFGPIINSKYLLDMYYALQHVHMCFYVLGLLLKSVILCGFWMFNDINTILLERGKQMENEGKWVIYSQGWGFTYVSCVWFAILFIIYKIQGSVM